MPRISRTVIEYDIEAAFRDSAAAAGQTVLRTPFGRDWIGRAYSFIALNFHGIRALARRSAKMPRFFRIASACAFWIVFFHIAFVLATSLSLYLFKTVNPGATTLMVYRAKVNGWKIAKPRFIALTKIPRATRNMTVRVEDGNFYEHHGIDLAAIKHAYELNRHLRTPLYGGSTITMQTARTIFLVPEKSYARKYFEAIIALEMELILGKKRILELYFNYAEWGKGIFGIEAASRHHYKESVADLSTDQAIRLVTLLSSPIRFSPYAFGRNGILWSRYAYLTKRWGEKESDPPAESPLVPLSTGEPDTEASADAAVLVPALIPADPAAAPAAGAPPAEAPQPEASAGSVATPAEAASGANASQ